MFARIDKLRSGTVVCVILCMIFFYAGASCASESRGAYTQQVGNATINWLGYTISASGEGTLPQMEMKWDKAERIATRDALIKSRYNLLQAIKKFRVNKDLFVGERFEKDKDLAENILGTVNNSRLINKNVKDSKKVEVKTEIQINSELAQQIIPGSIWYSDEDSSGAYAEKMQESNREQAEGSRYTGVIVDARNISAQPALVFRLFDQKGEAVYGPRQVDIDAAYTRGMAIYVQDKDTAVQTNRVGSNPLVVRAIRAVQNATCNLVLPSGEANELRKIGRTTDLLDRSRVAVVLTSEDGLVEYKIN